MSWPQVPLDSLCEINVGRTPSRYESAYWEDGIHPWVSIADMSRSRRILQTKESISEQARVECNMKPVAPGTVLMSFKLSIGKISFADRELYTNEAIAALPVLDAKQLDSAYLARALEALDFSDTGNRAVMGKTLNKAGLKKLKIPLPPLDEQKRIAAILDQADELRRKRQRAIDRLNQLGQAIFHEMFGDATTNPMGWRTAQLGDIVRSGDKINYGVVQPGEDVENGVPLVRVGDLLSGYIDPGKVKQIDASIEAGYKRSRLVGDEILIGCVGSIGTVALAHEGLRGANIARAVARVPVDAGIAMRDFIAEQIKSPVIQRYFTSETRTVAQPTLNIGLIVSAPIILPPLSEQKKFAEKISAIRSALISSLDHAAKQDALFSSLQHRAFQGEL